jgi:hypothetical protein
MANQQKNRVLRPCVKAGFAMDNKYYKEKYCRKARKKKLRDEIKKYNE